ncbi:alpha-ketoacid dehydrogenase subunit beta [Megalodesulfovibrio paquesii]
MPWTVLPEATAAAPASPAAAGATRSLSYRQALLEAQRQALAADPAVFVMGEGVDDPAGSFGTTLGLQEQFGAERVFDLPLAENGCLGAAVGAALAGMRPIVVHLRADFLLLALDQLANHAAKWRYMFAGRQPVPLVVRAVIGRGWGSAAQHSQPLHGILMQFPGLKVALPSTAQDAKGLLLAAIADPGPVVVLEHRWLYDDVGHVPEAMYRTPLGAAVVRRAGADVTIAAISLMVREALKAAELLAEAGIQAEVLDLRCAAPLDHAAIAASVARTGRIVVADTGHTIAGLAAEIAAIAAESRFNFLKAPVTRVGLPPAPTPAGHVLEQAYYPGAEALAQAARRLVEHRP